MFIGILLFYGLDHNGSQVFNYYNYNKIINTLVSLGPLPHTAVDFWRMVWEFKLPTIVMLTKEIEEGVVS